jgi:hypothetical protein
VGNTDIEDSLERLDKLTQEEARMASVELLKMTQSVDGKVMGVRSDVQDVRDDVQGVGNKVQDVDDRVQDIGKDIFIKVQGVDDRLDQASRSLFLQRLLIIPTAQTTSQETSSETTFYDGYRPQIHLRIITSHPKLIIMVQLNGFSKAVCLVNGNQPVPSCGYTENVRYIWPSPSVNP